MGVPRAKKIKRPIDKPIKDRSPYELIQTANYLNLAAMLMSIKAIGLSDRTLARYVESYMALMQEVADTRCGVWEMVRDCQIRTGYNVVELLDGGRQ